jgi:bifunctional UDP-N-acetylglucosamine pyrophosphorylase/glucosamine-1-phosphate N-acetyltransferase
MDNKPLDVLILAAGLGTRMRSDIAKVLHRLDGRPLINHVCRTAAALAPRKVYVVVGHQGDEVREAVLTELGEEYVEFVWQKDQLGTGDAVNSAREFLENEESELLVLSGDVPMIRAETLAGLIRQHQSHRGKGAACTVLTVELGDPRGYGRVIRDSAGLFEKIVEQKDATNEELEVREINAGIYCFDTAKLFDSLSKVSNHNAQGEYYLTDVPGVMRAAEELVSIYKHGDSSEIEGVNDRMQLSELERSIRRRTVKKLMMDFGVTVIDPYNTYVGGSVSVGRDTVIYPNVTLEGETRIGDGCVIRSGTRIRDSRIGHGVEILDNCVIENAEVKNGCRIGPFAHLRPGATLEEGARVGNFVEVKKSVIGRNSKANHLTYIGDAKIGENTNIGAGTITCNFDGKNKHATEIGDNVKIGSDTMLVAPVKVGDGSVTGAGTVVTKDVPPNKLVVGSPGRVIRSLGADDPDDPDN